MTEPVLAPPWRPPRLGLLSASIDGLAADGAGQIPRWEAGFQWVPTVQCPGAGEHIWDPACNTPAGLTTDVPPTKEDHVPLAVAVGVKCSTAGMSAPEADVEARAAAALEVAQHRLIEAEFYAGTVATAGGLGNEFLTDGNASVLEAGTIHPVRALAVLEDRAGDTVGGQAYIHANRRIVTWWANQHLLRREAGSLLTMLDTIVVPGVGYGIGGSGPLAGTANEPWAFVTAPTVARLGKVQHLAPTGDQISTDNLRRAWAYRAFAVTFDPCGFGAIRVDLCNWQDPCPGS